MQRCLQIRLPLHPARLQAAAITRISWPCGRAFSGSLHHLRYLGTVSQQAVREDALSGYEQNLKKEKRRGREKHGSQSLSWPLDTETVEEREEDKEPIHDLYTAHDELYDERHEELLLSVFDADITPGDVASENHANPTPVIPRKVHASGSRGHLGDMKIPQLHAALEKLQENETQSRGSSALNLDLHPSAKDWALTFLEPNETRNKWSQAFLWILTENKQQTLRFLARTSGLMQIPIFCVTKALYLQAWDLKRRDEGDSTAMACREMFKELVTLLPTLKSQPRLPPVTLEMFLQYLPAEDIRRLMEFVHHGQITVNWRSYCIWSRYYARHGDIEQAVSIYAEALQLADPAEKVMRWTLNYLITQLVEHPDGYLQSLRLCEAFKQYGGRFDKRIGTYLVATMLDLERDELAAQLYLTIFDREVPPTHFATAALLKAHEERPGRGLPLSKIIEDAFHYNHVSEFSGIAHRLFYSEAVQAVQDDITTAWPRVCSLFKQIFNSDVFAELGLPDNIEQQREHRQHSRIQKQQPSGHAITNLLQVYLQVSNAGGLVESDPVDVYKAWQSLLKRGSQPYLAMTTSDYAYNAFMHAFIKDGHSLINATDVMRDMQTPLPEALETEQSKPTAISWNIFLMGFQRHDKPELADKVLEHMNTIGIEPTPVTWNIMMGHAVKSDSLDRILNVLDRAEIAGVEMNPYMGGSLKRFRDQAALSDALVKKLDFSSELKNSIGARLGTEVVETDGQETEGPSAPDTAESGRADGSDNTVDELVEVHEESLDFPGELVKTQGEAAVPDAALPEKLSIPVRPRDAPT